MTNKELPYIKDLFNHLLPTLIWKTLSKFQAILLIRSLGAGGEGDVISHYSQHFYKITIVRFSSIYGVPVFIWPQFLHLNSTLLDPKCCRFCSWFIHIPLASSEFTCSWSKIVHGHTSSCLPHMPGIPCFSSWGFSPVLQEITRSLTALWRCWLFKAPRASLNHWDESQWINTRASPSLSGRIPRCVLQ